MHPAASGDRSVQLAGASAALDAGILQILTVTLSLLLIPSKATPKQSDLKANKDDQTAWFFFQQLF